METGYYGIESDFAQIKSDNLQIIKDIASKVGFTRHDLTFGMIFVPKIKSLEKKIEKPITVQA